jgi:hypothetical protein
MQVGHAHAQQASPPVKQEPVTAIDVLLEPDATMLRHAEASNARLLEVYPQGFALDAAHRPHITMIQRFVRTADLDRVYAAAGKVLAGANVNAMKLEAFIPGDVERWSLTSLRDKVVKIGAKVVSHGRYAIFQMAEVAVPRELFGRILDRISRLRPPDLVPC